MRSLLFLLSLLLACALTPAQASQRDAFDRITAAEAGYSDESLQALATYLDESVSDSLLLLHDGKVFLERGDTRKKVLAHSIRKALLNSLIGVHLGEGCLRLDSTLAELGIADLSPALTAIEKSATLEQLPGEHYDNWDFNVGGAIFEQCTGPSMFDAFNEEVARPLGMLDWTNQIDDMLPKKVAIDPQADGAYQLNRTLPLRAYRLRMSAHDLALFGQLYLQRGRWRGRQVVPMEWIDRSTRPISITEPEYGLAYGMLWDVVVPDRPEERASFFHTGAGVHMLGVYPRHGPVMVHRVDTEQDYRFNDGDLYQAIRKMHGARLADSRAGQTPTGANP